MQESYDYDDLDTMFGNCHQDLTQNDIMINTNKQFVDRPKYF